MTLPNSDHGVAGLSPAGFRAYKKVVQFIHSNRLDRGSRLPVQQELRHTLGLTNDALTRAMRLLCDQGVLDRKSKAGTRVVDRAAIPPLPWRLGVANVAAPEIGPLSVFSMLSHHVQIECARRGWSTQTYYRFSRADGHPSFEEFGDLRAHLDAGQLDGLFLLTTVKPEQWSEPVADGVPLCHALFWDEAPCGVVLDRRAMAESAVAHLVEAGCRRIAAVVATEADAANARLREGLARGLAAAGPGLQGGQVIVGDIGVPGGQAAAAKWLEMPDDIRPDGIIVFDDYIALGLAEALRERAGRARSEPPTIVTTSHRQMPLAYHLPVIRLEIDLHDIAAKTVAMMAKRLLRPREHQTLQYYVPQQVQQPHVATGSSWDGL